MCYRSGVIVRPAAGAAGVITQMTQGTVVALTRKVWAAGARVMAFVAIRNGMRARQRETGGRVIEVGNKIEKLRQAFDQISQELRSQYNAGYVPTNTTRDGSFRKVEIKPKQGDYKIQARSGYYATPRHED